MSIKIKRTRKIIDLEERIEYLEKRLNKLESSLEMCKWYF